MSSKKILMLILILIIGVSTAFIGITQMNVKTILSVYTDNINSFIETIEANKNKSFLTYKDTLNEKIKCEQLQCSYTTEYKNEMVKNSEVVFKLRENQTPEKIIYKFDAIKRIDSESAETRIRMKEYYHELEKELKEKNVNVYYSTKDSTKLTLDECFNTVGCLFVIEFK